MFLPFTSGKRCTAGTRDNESPLGVSTTKIVLARSFCFVKTVLFRYIVNYRTCTFTVECKCTYTLLLQYTTQCTASTSRYTTTCSKLHTISKVPRGMSPDMWGSSSGRGHVLVFPSSTRHTCTQTRNSERKPT